MAKLLPDRMMAVGSHMEAERFPKVAPDMVALHTLAPMDTAAPKRLCCDGSNQPDKVVPAQFRNKVAVVRT